MSQATSVVLDQGVGRVVAPSLGQVERIVGELFGPGGDVQHRFPVGLQRREPDAERERGVRAGPRRRCRHGQQCARLQWGLSTAPDFGSNGRLSSYVPAHHEVIMRLIWARPIAFARVRGVLTVSCVVSPVAGRAPGQGAASSCTSTVASLAGGSARGRSLGSGVDLQVDLDHVACRRWDRRLRPSAGGGTATRRRQLFCSSRSAPLCPTARGRSRGCISAARAIGTHPGRRRCPSSRWHWLWRLPCQEPQNCSS